MQFNQAPQMTHANSKFSMKKQLAMFEVFCRMATMIREVLCHEMTTYVYMNNLW